MKLHANAALRPQMGRALSHESELGLLDRS
jgi:hypothetical protein